MKVEKLKLSFTKPKSSIMIHVEGQRDSDAGEVDKEEGLLDSRRKRWKKKKKGEIRWFRKKLSRRVKLM